MTWAVRTSGVYAPLGKDMKERHPGCLCLFRSKRAAPSTRGLLGPEDAERFPSQNESCVWFVPPREENVFPALLSQNAEKVGMMHL